LKIPITSNLKNHACARKQDVLATRDFTVYFWTNETPKTFGPVMMFKELRTGKKD
jgi:hypothetical protein